MFLARSHDTWYSERRDEFLLVAVLMLLYTAFFSGHFYSIDGMIMFQQARSLFYDQALMFRRPIEWGMPIVGSKYGIGLSLLYLPGLALFTWLRPWVHQPHGDFDFGLIYLDPVYTVGGAPMHIFITALTAYVIGRFCRRLGLGRNVALWSMALFGVGSPAFVYARGDFAQPLTGLCWIAALYCAFDFCQTQSLRAAFWCAFAVGYAVLTRPLEGALLLPATAALLVHATITKYSARNCLALGLVVLAWCIAVLITIVINHGRYGTWFVTGYEGEGWNTSLLIGVPGLLFSPARGLLWAFPAVVLIPSGIHYLWCRHHRVLVCAFLWLIGSLIVLAGTWYMWWGGHNWGPRLLVSMLPVLAVLVGAGVAVLPQPRQAWIAGILAAIGLLWVLPGITVDLLSGYNSFVDGSAASFRLKGYPPLSAWRFVDHWFATSQLDNKAIDILWLRFARYTKGASLVPFFICIITAVILLRRLLDTGSSRSGIGPSNGEVDIRGDGRTTVPR